MATRKTLADHFREGKTVIYHDEIVLGDIAKMKKLVDQGKYVSGVGSWTGQRYYEKVTTSDPKMYEILHDVKVILGDVRAELGSSRLRDIDIDRLILDVSVIQAKLQQQDR